MKIYIRKIDNQAINKQISILNDTVKSFFDGMSEVRIQGKKSGFIGNVSILLATDPRLGKDIKKIIEKEGGMRIGNLMAITKLKRKYLLEILTPQDSEYKILLDMFEENERHLEIIKDDTQFNDYSNSKNKGYNKIYYGIPGCGKSYKIKKELEGKHVPQENIFRTTFYLDYSNSDFVGQILPKVEGEDVKYEYNPGPFTKALTRAFNTNDMVYLIIEEINRGNAGAIFGDLFQLLDRKKDDDGYGPSGESEYPITNEFLENYLKKNVDDGYDKGVIYIPNNLTIFATMNTSDQNVFPLDTAFKRRWDMERVEGDINDCEFKDYYIPYTEITWQNFQEEVNKKISESSLNGLITEDKQLGPWFANKDMFVKEEKQSSREKLEKFVYNVMDYIYNDVCKFEKEGWFTGEVSFAEICRSILKYPDDQNIDKDLCLAFLKKYTDNKESNDDQS